LNELERVAAVNARRQSSLNLRRPHFRTRRPKHDPRPTTIAPHSHSPPSLPSPPPLNQAQVIQQYLFMPISTIPPPESRRNIRQCRQRPELATDISQPHPTVSCRPFLLRLWLFRPRGRFFPAFINPAALYLHLTDSAPLLTCHLHDFVSRRTSNRRCDIHDNAAHPTLFPAMPHAHTYTHVRAHPQSSPSPPSTSASQPHHSLATPP